MILNCIILHLCHAQESRDSVAKIRSSLLNLVDLAGSERQRDARTEGLRLKVIIILVLHMYIIIYRIAQNFDRGKY